jgi:hypothetical protein
MKTSPFGPIREARKLAFSESISKTTITVELNEVGWIHVRQCKGLGGLFGHTPKYADISLTTEDARNLIKCLSEFVPQGESEKSCE